MHSEQNNRTQKMNPAKTFTPAELAWHWNVSTKTVLRAIGDGLPVLRLNARVLRISEVDAAIFYASRRVSSSSTSPAFTEPNRRPLFHSQPIQKPENES